ncbi:histidine phosphatase superfamily [Xylaria cf. heliscus]|nr:histidine phosphatase superfamily [Xylaria cf. heliscus]
MSMIFVLRHGQSFHNVHRGYPFRDPPLTELGCEQARNVKFSTDPDLIIISPMTRTIQTASLVFGHLIDRTRSAGHGPSKSVEVQIWPELREAHDAICNIGIGRVELEAKFPQFDFSACNEVWDYPSHSPENARERAERVRQRLTVLSASYKKIVVVTHRGFISFLVQGSRFDLCGISVFSRGYNTNVLI